MFCEVGRNEDKKMYLLISLTEKTDYNGGHYYYCIIVW